MRISSPLVRGKSAENAPFFAYSSIVTRTLRLGLPLLALVLALIFLTTGRSIESVVNRAITRNAQVQARAMVLAVNQVLVETRNQLLILAAGSMDRQEMLLRLKFRSQADNLRYREVAFMGVAPENRYLLLNYGDDIISVPLRLAMDTPAGPFQNLTTGQKPGQVIVSPPLEVSYSMIPIHRSLQSLSFYVLRFSTPVYNAAGNFEGILILSLDLRALRNTMSSFSLAGSSDSEGEETHVRSLFFDRDGWMLFQSEDLLEVQPEEVLSSDDVRTGFRGDFGRPGYSTAFRPGPEHMDYWHMVAEIQAGHSGQIALSDDTMAWASGPDRVEAVSFAPLTFKPCQEADPVILGGLALLDSSFSSTRTGMQLLGVYASCFLGGLLLLGLCLWWLARNAVGSLGQLAAEIRQRNEEGSADPLHLPPLPRELERIKRNVNIVLARLRRAKTEQLSQAEQKTARWQHEPVEDLPPPPAYTGPQLVGDSLSMQALYGQIQKASEVRADVLVVGETGTGKELVSQAIHQLSDRADSPFITINCGALDEALLMDTLFGHVKGAFTEARQARKGAFLAAEGGTLMLDEIGNAAPRVQQALLRALSTRYIRPLGADHDVPFDTRIIAATNADLLEDGQDGSFRTDLYYRLAVITIQTPPLRQRREDIPALVVYFMAAAVASRLHGLPRQLPRISRGALEKLMHYDWPGNVRELKNTLTRALAFCEGDLILAEHIQLDTDVEAQACLNSGRPAFILPDRPAPASDREDGSHPTERTASLPPAADQSPTPPERTTQPLRSADFNGAAHIAAPADAAETARAPYATGGSVPERPMPATAQGGAGTSSGPGSSSGPGPSSRAASGSLPPNPAEALPEAGLLNRRQRELLPRLRALGSTSRQEYQELALQLTGEQISMRTAQYDLQQMVQLGLLRKEGRGPALRYVVV